MIDIREELESITEIANRMSRGGGSVVSTGDALKRIASALGKLACAEQRTEQAAPAEPRERDSETVALRERVARLEQQVETLRRVAAKQGKRR